MSRHAIIVGGSISGLFAGCLLRRMGWRVDVFERSYVELKGRGAGIVCHQELQDILTMSGAGVADLGVHIEDRILLDRLGNVVAKLHFPQIVTSWDRMQNLGRNVQPKGAYHLHHNFIGFDQTTNGVIVHFEGRQSVRGDILVGADGFRSAVRGIVAPDIQPIYAGYVIWRALVDEADLDPETHAAIFEKFAFFLSPGHEVIGYPIAGIDNDLQTGKRRYNFVWYRTIPVPRLNEMLTDKSGQMHSISIPSPLIRQEIVQEMRETAETFMCDPLLKVLRAIKSAFFTPIYDLASNSMIFGRVVLIGDAAFVGQPHVGMGVTKGVADARSLADALAGENIDEGLREFNEKRKPVGNRVVERGRELGAFLYADSETEQKRVLDKKRTNNLLRDTAADNFLYERAR